MTPPLDCDRDSGCRVGQLVAFFAGGALGGRSAVAAVAALAMARHEACVLTAARLTGARRLAGAFAAAVCAGRAAFVVAAAVFAGARFVTRLVAVRLAGSAFVTCRTSLRVTSAEAATTAAPTMPASFCSVAGTTLVRTFSSGMNLSAFRLAPPPMMMMSGANRASSSLR